MSRIGDLVVAVTFVAAIAIPATLLYIWEETCHFFRSS